LGITLQRGRSELLQKPVSAVFISNFMGGHQFMIDFRQCNGGSTNFIFTLTMQLEVVVIAMVCSSSSIK